MTEDEWLVCRNPLMMRGYLLGDTTMTTAGSAAVENCGSSPLRAIGISRIYFSMNEVEMRSKSQSNSSRTNKVTQARFDEQHQAAAGLG